MYISHRTALRGSTLLAVTLAVGACGSGKDPTPGATTPPPVVTVRQEDQFGVQFGLAFRADNNSEPFNVNDGDLVAISLTTEPVDIK